MSWTHFHKAAVENKRVLVRADLNVPMEDGKVTDATRIIRTLPTLQYLRERGAKVIVLSHFGRPKGVDPSQSLKPVAENIAQHLGAPVAFAPDCIGPTAENAVASLRAGDILVLENLRFHAGEEKNDPAFTAALTKLGDVYVNDAFSASHRAHASITGLPQHMPAYAGASMAGELSALEKALNKPQHPLVAIVGGAKVSTKLAVLEHLVEKVDTLILGGGMANTFLAAQGTDVGPSLQEPALHETAKRILASGKILLPVDAVCAEKFDAAAKATNADIQALPHGHMILDIGPKTVALIAEKLGTAKTIVWNGPMGAFELVPFAGGTIGVAKAVAAATKAGAISVAGGGDTVAALEAAGAVDALTYVSTAGGAFLEWLEGKALPGVTALG